MSWILLISVILVSAAWVLWKIKNRRLVEMSRRFPGPPTLPVLGNALMFMCRSDEMVTVIKQMILDYGDIIRFWLGPDLNIVVSDPNAIKTLLTNNKTNAKGPQYRFMADVLGGGILSGSGPTWRRHRKIATPNYGKKSIESYSEVFNKEVEILLGKFRNLRSEEEIDIYKLIVQTTSYSVCQTLMGLSKTDTMKLPHLQNLIDDTPRLYDVVFDRMTKWWLQLEPIFYFTSSYNHQQQFKEMLNEFSSAIIKHRLEYLASLRDDFKTDLMMTEEDILKNTQLSVIDRLILSKELDDKELLQETFSIFTTSQEASAKITSFIFLMMAYHPDCQAKLNVEIQKVVGNKDRNITDEDLKKMPYLDMVFKEVLRLYPIGAILQRTVLSDITVDSSTIPAGSSLVIPVYHIHRDPRFWSDPDAFDPERFNSENTQLRHPNCYIPFSLGPMDCLGRYFGTKLIKTICVRILREFEVTSTKKYKDLRISMAISASPMDGFWTKLTPRFK